MRGWCKGWDSNPRFPNYQFGALPTWPPLHIVVLFICPRKHQTRVCKFYLYPTYQKVLALRLIELTCSIYIPYPAFGCHSIQLLRTSLRLFVSKPFPNKTITSFFFTRTILSNMTSNRIYRSFGFSY